MGKFKRSIAYYPCSDEKICKSLREKGYFVFRDSVPDIEDWKNTIENDGRINYGLNQEFSDNMVESIGKKIGWNPVYSKYRFSTGGNKKKSNATDAAALHRDIMFYEEGDILPIFTLVTYLSKSKLKCVEGSHIKPNIPFRKAIFEKTKFIEFNAGDSILFHATLLHGGVFTNLSQQRIVNQCFEVFPNKEIAEETADKIIHLWATAKDQKKGNKYAKLATLPIIKKIILSSSYHVNAQGYGKGRFKLPHGKSIISGEITSRAKSNTIDIPNLYKITNEKYTHSANEKDNERLRNEVYYYNYSTRYTKVFLSLFIPLMLIIITLIVFKKRGKRLSSEIDYLG